MVIISDWRLLDWEAVVLVLVDLEITDRCFMGTVMVR